MSRPTRKQQLTAIHLAMVSGSPITPPGILFAHPSCKGCPCTVLQLDRKYLHRPLTKNVRRGRNRSALFFSLSLFQYWARRLSGITAKEINLSPFPQNLPLFLMMTEAIAGRGALNVIVKNDEHWKLSSFRIGKERPVQSSLKHLSKLRPIAFQKVLCLGGPKRNRLTR